MNDIFEKLRSGEAVDMAAPKYGNAIKEMQRSTRLCARISAQLQAGEDTVGLTRELLNGQLGENSYITPPFMIDFGNQVSLGKNVFINHSLTLMSAGSVTVDEGAMIGPNVKIYTDNHDFQNRMVLRCKPVHILKNAWIGGGAIILPGITIGENAVVGSGAVVTHDVEADTVVAGNPARVIKKL